ncbi:hypothetical protein [Fodinicola feengrottensis]|nr:hypothetical protein [Fodinicola feengrottensis]
MLRRRVRAYVSHRGEYLGTLDIGQVDSPWWSEAQSVNAAVDAKLGTEVAICRLLTVVPDGDHGPRGGEVAYHVEVLGAPTRQHLNESPVDDWAAIIAPHPLRSAWATPDGVRDLLDWATAAADRPLRGKSWQWKT